jgi:hypothetical protein
VQLIRRCVLRAEQRKTAAPRKGILEISFPNLFLSSGGFSMFSAHRTIALLVFRYRRVNSASMQFGVPS